MESREYLRRAEAARYLQERYGAYTAQTLAKLACVGGGPVYRKMGAYPVYRKRAFRSTLLPEAVRPS